MLTNGQFFPSFVFALCATGISVIIAGIVFAGIQIRQSLKQVPIDIRIGILVICFLPLLVFAAVGIPLKSVIGIAAAGALIGMFCAPFMSWRYRRFGASKAFGIFFLTIIGGALSSLTLIALLITMAWD